MFVPAIESLNTKFIPIFWNFLFSKSRSMSPTFCINSGELGRTIFGQFLITSAVANSNVIAYPSLSSKPIRASKYVNTCNYTIEQQLTCHRQEMLSLRIGSLLHLVQIEKFRSRTLSPL